MRFASRDELLAQLWLRSIRRFHEGFVAALTGPAPLPSAATFLPRYCRAHPTDYIARAAPIPGWIDEVVATASGVVLDEFHARS
ncbi:hypothetical protein [Nocardia fluminea]|uniref:hypothetical protein n=1 Tax=Nocardia fluminea TaxID=134984 RepID=UPI001FE50633|nr:hypothetical protein [Nocardia fluminea]